MVQPIVDSGSRDRDGSDWARGLHAGARERERVVGELHALLLRFARTELYRRGVSSRIAGPELDDIAHECAADALLAITAKLSQFRGASRFTTWAYRFVVLEVSSKLGKHSWRHAPPGPVELDWEALPDRTAATPPDESEGRELLDRVRRAVAEDLSDRQRLVFVAVVLNATPMDVVATELNTTRGAVHKSLFDARRKLRAVITESGQGRSDR